MQTFQSRAAAAMTSVVLRGRGAILVDPGILPDELDRIEDYLRTAGVRPDAVILTHCHWDHVAAATRYGVPILTHPDFTRWLAIMEQEEPAAEGLQRAYDRFGLGSVPAIRLPTPDATLGDDEVVHHAGLDLHVVHLPGHTGDGLGLVVDDTLICGDILDSLELPLPLQDLDAYFQSLARIEAILPHVARVVPGHGPALSAVAARSQLDRDRRYLQELDALARDAAARGFDAAWPAFSAMSWFGKGDPDRDGEHALNVREIIRRRTTPRKH